MVIPAFELYYLSFPLQKECGGNTLNQVMTLEVGWKIGWRGQFVLSGAGGGTAAGSWQRIKHPASVFPYVMLGMAVNHRVSNTTLTQLPCLLDVETKQLTHSNHLLLTTLKLLSSILSFPGAAEHIQTV